MALSFAASPAMSLGVEMELQLVDPVSLDLTPAAPRLLARLGDDAHIKPEIFQSMIEINTGVCANAAEARRDLDAAVTRLRAACALEQVALASAGSHPFARARDRVLFPAERYDMLIDRNRWVARRLMIFGLHVHVGMRDGEHAVQLLNGVLQYLPHALALSASSPYWQGIETGLASSRTTVFEALPTGGHPCTYGSWKTFEALYDAMLASKAITSIKDIWWDIRPSPHFGTVEVRICDGLPSVRATCAIAAFVHALFAWLNDRHDAGERFLPPAYWIMRENKWRASRWGLDARFVLDDSGRHAHVREEFDHLLTVLEPVAARQGAAAEFAVLREILARPSYQHQREVFAQTDSYQAVARALVDWFDAPDGPPPAQ